MQDTTSWLKQTLDKPLFPALLWSRPENRALAGKLLIIGGNKYEFSAPAEAFQEATKAGIGVARVLLPDSLKHTVGKILIVGDYAPSTPSGSFGQLALNQLIGDSAWADGVLLAGDLGRNSETAIVLEKFVQTYHGQLTITKDAIGYVTNSAHSILNRPNTTLVLSFAQLQKLAIHVRFQRAFTFDMGLVRLVEALHDFCQLYPITIVVKYHEDMVISIGAQVSTTKLGVDMPIWRVKFAAHCAVWWLQNSSAPLQALSTAVYVAIEQQ